MNARFDLIPIINDILQGDRMILPSNILQELVDNDKELIGLSLKLIHEDTIIYGSMLQFTAQENFIEMSRESFELLNVSSMETDTDNNKIVVEIVSLPKATMIALTPLDSTYLSIQNMKATLESHIRKHYSTLFLGLTITLKSHHNTIKFKITDMRPGDACSTINTDIEVDVIPLDDIQAIQALQTVNHQRFPRKLKTVVRSAVPIHKNEEIFFWFEVEREDYVDIQVEASGKGECHLFVGEGNSACGMTGCIDYRIEEKMCVKVVDMTLVSVCVRGWVDTDFILTVTLNKNEEVSVNAETSQCTICEIYFPTKELMHHSLFCVRSTIDCSICWKRIPISDIQKHHHCLKCVSYIFTLMILECRYK